MSVRAKATTGHWMVTALGDTPRRQHFVPIGAAQWHDSGGFPMGWYARCGKRAMAATAKYRHGIQVCSDCAALVPNPVEHC